MWTFNVTDSLSLALFHSLKKRSSPYSFNSSTAGFVGFLTRMSVIYFFRSFSYDPKGVRVTVGPDCCSDHSSCNKKLSYCWETARRESMPKIACWNGSENYNLGWSDLQMYFKVIKSGTNRKLIWPNICMISTVLYCNFCRITQRLREIWGETV